MTSKAMAAVAHAAHHAHGALERVKTGVWIFLASECIVFGSLIGTYLGLYGRSVSGPTPHEMLNVPVTAIATFILLASSFTMVMAIAAIREGKVGATQGWLALTIVLGLVFLGFQAKEYMEFAAEGLHFNTNIFAATFYSTTGLHGTHVFIGALWLLGVLVNSLRGRVTKENAATVECAGLYWHFVDMVWMIIFPTIYLMEFAKP